MLISILRRSIVSRPLKVKKLEIPSYCRMIRQITQRAQIAKEDSSEDVSKIIMKEARDKLQKILGVKEFDALKIVSSHKKFIETPKDMIIKNYELCLEHNLPIKTILNYASILCDPKLEQKIELLRRLPIDLLDSIPLARCSKRMLLSLIRREAETLKRIDILCKIFDIICQECCDILSLKTFLFRKPLYELEELLRVFYDYGFSKKELLNDLWVLKYSEEFIKNRLDFIKHHNIASLKTWMIRCPEETLYRHIKRETDNRYILGENSVAQYLSEKLRCDESIAKSLIRKHPQLQNKSLLKMNGMIDLLYKQGFTPLQICKVPKVLCHSTKTTEQRLKELSKLGKKLDSLYILTKSQKQYLQHVENLIKSK